MVLKSRRSTRWPYLFRSTIFGAGVWDFERTTWNSLGSWVVEFWDVVGLGDLAEGCALVVVVVVFVEVRERAGRVGRG